MRRRARDEQRKGQYEDLIRKEQSTSDSSTPASNERHINFFADMKTGVWLLLVLILICSS